MLKDNLIFKIVVILLPILILLLYNIKKSDGVIESFEDLEQLIKKYEKNNLLLTDAPQKLVKKYGYVCLSNSLMYKTSAIPKHNSKEISNYIETHTFRTIDSLIDYINTLTTDIDKLFAIFSYASLNIRYNVKLLHTKSREVPTLEKIFKLN